MLTVLVSRRDEVLDIGLRLFAEQGYVATTTAQIEQALGLKPGSGGLFRHVGSKRELLEAALERALDRRHQPPPGPFRSPAHALTAATLHLVDADPHLWRLILREGRGLPVDVDALYDRLVRPAFDQAVEWVRAHAGDSPGLRTRVTVGISALLYLRVSQLVYGRVPADVDEAEFVALVEGWLTVPAGPGPEGPAGDGGQER